MHIDHSRDALAAQLSVLQACPTVVSRILKHGDSTLLAAKVLVLSRLLHKTLSQQPEAPPLVDAIRNRLASLRSKLLKHIDRQFASPDADASVLIENMSAFALANSATPTDILRHFQHIRLEAIQSQFEAGDNHHMQILQALKLYVRTLQESQQLFPARVASALASIKTQTLLQDRTILSLTLLNLDVHSRWISDEVRNYTPWPRHDALQKHEAEKVLKTWAQHALGVFLSGSKSLLCASNDLGAVMSLRKDLLETWLSSSGKLVGIDPDASLDSLRETLNERLLRLIQDRAENLARVSQSISEVVAGSRNPQDRQHLSLWDNSLTDGPPDNGAAALKQALINRTRGRTDTVLQIITVFDLWTFSIADVRTSIKIMKEVRWDDDFAADDDEFGLDSKQALLSQDDPKELEDGLDEALAEALMNFKKDLAGLIRQVLESDMSDHAEPVTFLLRIIREGETRLASISATSSGSRSGQLRSLVPPLLERLSNVVVAEPLSSYQQQLQKFAQAPRCPARVLWEGKPPLPVQPSPSAFKFLRSLVTEMSKQGQDIWTPEAVRAVKQSPASRITEFVEVFIKESWRAPRMAANEERHGISDQANGMAESDKPQEVVTTEVTQASSSGDDKLDKDDEWADRYGSEEAKEAKEGPPINGHTSASPSNQASSSAENEAVRTEKLTQLLFDICYLQRAFSSGESDLQDCAEKLRLRAVVDQVGLERLRKSAAEYWKRTYLLFGLLAA